MKAPAVVLLGPLNVQLSNMIKLELVILAEPPA
jgi:hypothetical protein